MNWLLCIILVLRVERLLSGPLNEQQMRLKKVAKIFDQSEENKSTEPLVGDILDRIKSETQKTFNDVFENEMFNNKYDLIKILADDKDFLQKRQSQISEDLEKSSGFFRKPCPAHLKICYFYG